MISRINIEHSTGQRVEPLLLNSCNLLLNKRVNWNIDMKNIIFLMTLIMGLSIIITTNAQAQTQNNTQVNQTGITNYLEGFQGVTVLYESPKTLVLTIADVSTFGPVGCVWSSIRLCERKRIFNRCCYRVYGNLIGYWRHKISHT